MREFIQNIEAVSEVETLNYTLLFKFVCAKIGGEAKATLLARTHVNNWEQAKAVLEENYSVRRTLDYYARKAVNSKKGPNETVSQWGAQIDTMCGDLHRAARKHMENLAWSKEKREGGGDITDLLIRACFIQDIYDDRIKTTFKTKSSIITPMAHLEEVALEEEISIRSERFTRNPPANGYFGNQKNKDVPWVKNERKEVRVATKARQTWQPARNCGKLPLSVGDARVKDTSENRHRCCLRNRRYTYHKQCSNRGKEIAYRGILHPVSTVYGDSVKDACVTPNSRNTPPVFVNDSVDVSVTPKPNISVTHTKDDRFSHPDNIPIIGNCVQTPDTLVYDQVCYKERKIPAKVQNTVTNYSNMCVQMKHGPFLHPFEIYVLCDSVKTGNR